MLERLRERLQKPVAERAFSNFTDVEEEVTNDASETLKDIARDIEATKALMTRITEQIAYEDEKRRNYKMLMQDVGDAWDEIVLPEEHPHLVYLFIKSVTLEMVSPNFFFGQN